MKGQWKHVKHFKGIDSNLRDVRYSENNKHQRANIHIETGEIISPQPEPFWENGTVTVKLRNGSIITNVGYPNNSPSALLSQGIHGLYEAPLPGQHVVVGYIHGDTQSPIILNRYPYNPSANPARAAAFYLPLTQQAVGITDVVLGHHMGSYVALRGTLPIPGAIEINAITTLSVVGKLEAKMSSSGNVSISGVIKTEVSALTNKITIDAKLNKIDITANPAAGMINIKPGMGGFLKLGNNPTQFCNNYPVCLFTGAPHSTSIDVMV